MTLKAVKKFSTYEEQIDLLQKRGMIVDDTQKAISILSEIGYYKLIGAYGLEFIDKVNEEYQIGTTFNKIYNIYQFDEAVRSILYTNIEKIEVRVKNKIAHYFSSKYESLGYNDNKNFDLRFQHKKFLETIEKEKTNQKETPFVKHHLKYEGIPIWVLIEMLPFGTWTTFFKYMKDEDRKKLASELMVNAKYKIKCDSVDNWLHQILKVRNICAHYGRLYNRTFDETWLPTIQKKIVPGAKNDRLFGIVIAIIKMLDNKITAANLITAFEAVIEKFDSVNIWRIGFPYQWKDILQDIICDRI